jgi:hypothetical protein
VRKFASQAEAAKLLNVDRSAVQRARIVQDKAARSSAARFLSPPPSEVARLSPDRQREIAAKGKKVLARKAKETRKRVQRRSNKSQKTIAICATCATLGSLQHDLGPVRALHFGRLRTRRPWRAND